MSRQLLVESYQNARNYLKSEDTQDAIFWLEKYSSHLPAEMSHEPMYWLVEQYLKIGDAENAAKSAHKYLDGCNYPHASAIAKQFSSLFTQYGFDVHSFTFLRLSKKYVKLQKKLRESKNEDL